jgi:hypothetical protein
VPSIVTTPEGKVTHVLPDSVWDYVIKNHAHWRTDEVRPLYMTERHMQEDTSLILDVKNPDALNDFLMKHLAKVKHVRGIWVLNMAKMKFFRIPLDRPREFSRFTVTIDAVPAHLDKIYDTIAGFKPGRDVMINYVANTFESFSAAIMISALARSRNHMESFVEDCIQPLEGVMGTELTYISKTKRLVTPEEWEESVGPFFMEPGGAPIKDIDPKQDDSMIAGC